ncbi:hypothetical protein N7495_004911 [Penicillium taxi]|uniref:uncharacterized protein n=1 Tax=Penicillium taxi TaxID=168475 RepID=UPI0025458950|nr:uncharacterized protein N7495_004911 [Penicillium taxi]KAJ5893220.1 hypothetical protein N7495_004911 [Penicillium taxi]
MPLDTLPVKPTLAFDQKPSFKPTKAREQNISGINGSRNTITALSEQIIEALFAESVEAKIWSVAARALGSVIMVKFQAKPPVLYPEYTNQDGTYIYRKLDFWTSGFFPGSIYLLLERSIRYNENTSYLSLGFRTRPHQLQLEYLSRWWTANLHQNALKRDTHDLGFMIAPWAMKAWELQRDPAAFNTLIMAAHSLASRFSATTRCLRSWDVCITKKYEFKDPSLDYLFIVDNMLNLDLLFWAARETSNSTLYEIARSHACMTQKHHVREDYSTFHVVNLDPETGHVKSKFTNQGYDDDSCWARGQAWGILGFMQTYQWTKEETFLNTARNLASYFVAQLPSDGVPYWDLTAPVTEKSPRDTSAAMIAACGLLLIHKALMNSPDAAWYLEKSLNLVEAVVSNFVRESNLRFMTAHPDLPVAVYPINSIDEFHDDGFNILQVTNHSKLKSTNCETILDGATINNYEFAPRKWSNHGLVYADYYFLLFGNMILEMGSSGQLNGV